VRRNLREGFEHASDVSVRLLVSPPIARVAIDVVEASLSCLRNSNGIQSRQLRFRAITSAAVSGV
jgi:hypothetical protein